MIEAIRRTLMALLMVTLGLTLCLLCAALGDLTGNPALDLPGRVMSIVVGVFAGLRAGNMLLHGRYIA